MLNLLFELKQARRLSEHAYQFAYWIHQRQQSLSYTQEQQDLAVLLAAMLAYYSVQGHTCLRLDSLLTKTPFGLDIQALEKKDQPLKPQMEIPLHLQKIFRISPLEWPSLLKDHIAFSDHPSRIAPLLFQHQRLYLYRYWQAENRIAEKMQHAVQHSPINSDEIALNKHILEQFFSPSPEKPDWQKLAVATALHKKFCLISGGPGTGKTYTVAMLLAALQLKQLKLGLPPLTIALAAPTGKAAARLKESITHTLQSSTLIPKTLKSLLPNNAMTLHRLLGIRPHCDLPQHHSKNPLYVDLLVVDEASMIDLFLMEKLFNALKPTTRLILLGDKDQLASVEAGNAMSELGELLTLGYSHEHSHYLREVSGYALYAQNEDVPAVCDSLCHLRESRRFGEHSGIGQLASLINAKQALKSWQLFTQEKCQDLVRLDYPLPQDEAEQAQRLPQCVKLVVEQAIKYYRPYLDLVKQRLQDPQRVSIEQIFEAFGQVRLLSALRISELGVERLNYTLAEALKHAHLVMFKHARESYFGKPILITENAPQNHIFSGDIGLMLPDEQGLLRVYFETQHNGKPLSLLPSRLPNYEPAYVMTVHKSQGSEFAHTLLILPLHASPVLTKELLYTAVTRAKEKFTVFADEKVWKYAVKTDIQRQSGLKAQILA